MAKKPKRQHVSVILDETEVAELDRVARQFGISRGAALRIRLRGELGRGSLIADMPRVSAAERGGR